MSASATVPTGVRRWGGYVAFVVVFAIACGLLSWWQWARRDEAIERVEVITSNYDAPAVPLAELLPEPGASDVQLEWHPVTLTGEYLEDELLLVRSRPHEGQPGFAQLVPFRLDDGRVIAVDRGWLPVSDDAMYPAFNPSPPAGEVQLVVRLKAGEPVLPGRGAPDGQLATINLPQVADALDGVIADEQIDTGMYGLLVTENPEPVDPRPAPAIKPGVDEGPHASYALQWIMFALVAITGLIWAYRREKRIAALPLRDQAAARRERRQGRDEDEEDALIDAASR